MTLKDGVRLEFTANADGTWNSIDVTGREVVLSNTGTIVLNATNVSALEAGNFTLLKAGTLMNATALENWTITCNIESTSLTFKVVVENNSILVRQSPAGTMVILR